MSYSLPNIDSQVSCEIPNGNKKPKKMKSTIRNLLLQFKSQKCKDADDAKIFITTEGNYLHTGYNMIYKKIYEQEAHLIASNIGAYIVDIYRDIMKQNFSEEEIQKIDTTKWENGKPISMEDMELD